MLEDKTARRVIVHLKSILARHGIPETIMSDNMPFNSCKFKEFAKSWDINPTYAQSNGLSERMVQTIKQYIRKAKGGKVTHIYPCWSTEILPSQK